jgi:hypothetical protein
MELTYKGEHPQFLGMLEGKPCVITKEKPLVLSEKDYTVLKDKKWFKHLMEKGLLLVDGKKAEQKEKENSKPKKKKEKAIRVEMD